MTKRSERLEPVLGIAERNEQAMSTAFARSQQRLDEACRKLDELLVYRGEYATALRRGRDGHVDVNRMLEERAFMRRLEDVVRFQQIEVEKLRQAAESARVNWLSSRQRSRSLDTLAGNYRKQEQAEAERREQQHSDELTTQRHVWRNLQQQEY